MKRIQYAIEHTEVLRPPKQSLTTFGTTNVRYYLVTEPIYSEMTEGTEETVVREGRVIAERPRMVTPFYLMNFFEGFEHGQEYAKFILRKYGSDEPGLLYRYKNEPHETNIVSSPLLSVVQNLNQMLDKEQDPLTAVIKGVDDLWDVSLMKFIHDLTRSSLKHNIMELGDRGLLDMDALGVPAEARYYIEQLFQKVKHGDADHSELKIELDRWGIFREYEDRFLSLFRKK